jgi:polysaccharide biosynthesis/export protein
MRNESAAITKGRKVMELRTRILAVVAFALLFGGSSTLRAQQVLAMPANGATNAALSAKHADDDHVAPAERNPRYRICRDDTMTLTFPLSPELNQKVTVQPDGFISLQNAGSLHVLGLTVPEVVEAVKKAYSKTLHDPIVDVDLIDFQRPYFVVLGQVGKPGQYDLRYDTTLTEAIALAGGFAPTSKTQVFLYHRGEGGWVEAKEIKIKDILHGKNVSEDVSMRPGDMIFVPEKTITKIRKYVPYSFGFGLNPSGYIF